MTALVRNVGQRCSAERVVNDCLAQLLKRSRQGAGSINKAIENPRTESCALVETEAREIIACLNAYNRIEMALAELQVETSCLRLCASSLFLRDAHRELIGDPEGRERLVVVTGPCIAGGIAVPSRIEAVALESQSKSYVAADRAACQRLQVELAAKHGHEVLAVFHSHMSEGAASTRQSSTDIAAQRRMEALGCRSISGIFSIDGFLRLSTLTVPFEFSVYGKGISVLEDTPHEKLLKLEAV